MSEYMNSYNISPLMPYAVPYQYNPCISYYLLKTILPDTLFDNYESSEIDIPKTQINCDCM